MYRFSFVVFKGPSPTTGLATKGGAAMTSGTSQQPSSGSSLWQFLESLTQGELHPVKAGAEDPPWFVSGVVHEIDEPTYWYFLELLPPRWMHGNWFAFGEGTGPFRLFWKMHEHCFARELTAEETVLFCKLSRTSLHQ